MHEKLANFMTSETEQPKMTADDVMKEALKIFSKQLSQSSPFVREVMFGDDPTGVIIRHQLQRDTHT